LIEALLITGTVGVGKTATAIEVGELLQARGFKAAVIDLDWLCWLCSPDAGEDQIDQVLHANLAAVVPRFVSAGVDRFVLARAIWQVENLQTIRSALREISMFTVRLDASPASIAARLAARHTGDALAAHLAESETFTKGLDATAFDAMVRTDGLDAAAAARAVLDAAGW
jgi:adenylylsulfate kinase